MILSAEEAISDSTAEPGPGMTELFIPEKKLKRR